MTLYNVISKVPGNGIVTVKDYITKEIYYDRKQAFEVIEKNDALWHRHNGVGLKGYKVYGIQVGKPHGDLVLLVHID